MQKTFKTVRDIKLNRVLLREAMQIKISIKMTIDLANIFIAFIAHFTCTLKDMINFTQKLSSQNTRASRFQNPLEAGMSSDPTNSDPPLGRSPYSFSKGWTV